MSVARRLPLLVFIKVRQIETELPFMRNRCDILSSFWLIAQLRDDVECLSLTI